MTYPHKWSPISYRSSAGQRKFAGQRPTFYRCATQPTSSSGRQPNFAALNRGRYLYFTGRPSRWALAHIYS